MKILFLILSFILLCVIGEKLNFPFYLKVLSGFVWGLFAYYIYIR